MIEVTARLKKWGRSFGIIVPMDQVKRQHLHVNDEVRILMRRKNNPLRETFGILKFKESTKEMLDEIDREGWDE